MIDEYLKYNLVFREQLNTRQTITKLSHAGCDLVCDLVTSLHGELLRVVVLNGRQHRLDKLQKDEQVHVHLRTKSQYYYFTITVLTLTITVLTESALLLP